MKITVKNSTSHLSSRINKEEFQRKASVVFNAVVRPQVQNASKTAILNTAQTANKKLQRPHLIIIAGCNGAGKSTYSHLLVKNLIPFDYDKRFLEIYDRCETLN